MIFIVPHTRKSKDGRETVASIYVTAADTFAEAEQRCHSAFTGQQRAVGDAVELDVDGGGAQIIDITKFRGELP